MALNCSLIYSKISTIQNIFYYFYFITLTKVKNAEISLMNHILIIFLRIILQRSEEYIPDTQFRFSNNLGTRDALVSIETSPKIYVCF